MAGCDGYGLNQGDAFHVCSKKDVACSVYRVKNSSFIFGPFTIVDDSAVTPKLSCNASTGGSIRCEGWSILIR